MVLSLARHAARLARTTKMSPELPIRVHVESANQTRYGMYRRPDKFDHCAVENFLDDGPKRAVLVGLPGAGKTYALRQAAARLAEELHEVCLSEPFDKSSAVVPIFVDLKLYRGDLADLVNQTLPPSLQFFEMAQRFRVKLFLDSFNEMPREYWESGSYEGDFAKFTESVGLSSMIISSRTNDGLGKLGFPAYCLDEIDEAIVSVELKNIGINTDGRFDREFRRLLQKPFYFQLVKSGVVSLPKEAHPKDFYQSFFSNIEEASAKRFGRCFEIEEILSIVAYDAINRGEEAYPLSDLIRVLKTNSEAAGLVGIDALDIANWLISVSVLIPHAGARIAFVHQSVTEYLAAKELARRYRTTPQILREKLTLTRWDQALFLALSLLPPSHAEAFFNDVVDADLALAMNAAKYLEDGRDDVVSKLLSLIPERNKRLGPFESRIEWIFESSLPLSKVHEPQLRSLMKLRNTIGGAAVKRLIAMKGPGIKNELFHEFVEARSDYNYCCNGLAKALKPFSAPEDVTKLLKLANSISEECTPDSDEHAFHGFTSGVAEFLADIDISIIKNEFLPNELSTPVPEIHARVLCNILWKHRSTAALELAGDLLLRGVEKSATAIYFIAGHGETTHDLSWTSFTSEHLDRLISFVENPDNDSWALKALKFLCSGRADMAEIVKTRAAERSGILKACLLYCTAETTSALLFEALREISSMSLEQRREEQTSLLEQIDVDWAGNEVLFVQLLKLRDANLALALLNQIYSAVNCPLGRIEIGPIEWWLDWLADEIDRETHPIFFDRISWLFSACLSKEAQQAFVKEFNQSGSKYRFVLSNSILRHQDGLTTDDFSADAVSFLLADLGRIESSYSWYGHILGRTATEQFVSERLLPLVSAAKHTLLKNLQTVLRQAGSRHGRRYLLD